jgi:hypothetical protein
LTDHGQVLATWNKREGELIAANKLDRIVAQPPNETNVHAGSASEDIKAKVGKEGARTIPGTSSLKSLPGPVLIMEQDVPSTVGIVTLRISHEAAKSTSQSTSRAPNSASAIFISLKEMARSLFAEPLKWPVSSLSTSRL